MSLVIGKGFEPLTHSLEGCCSIQLSYPTILFCLCGCKGRQKIKHCQMKNGFLFFFFVYLILKSQNFHRIFVRILPQVSIFICDNKMTGKLEENEKKEKNMGKVLLQRRFFYHDIFVIFGVWNKRWVLKIHRLIIKIYKRNRK